VSVTTRAFASATLACAAAMRSESSDFSASPSSPWAFAWICFCRRLALQPRDLLALGLLAELQLLRVVRLVAHDGGARAAPRAARARAGSRAAQLVDLVEVLLLERELLRVELALLRVRGEVLRRARAYRRVETRLGHPRIDARALPTRLRLEKRDPPIEVRGVAAVRTRRVPRAIE
jgi:hypothetical protein